MSLADELDTLKRGPATFKQWLAMKPADADSVIDAMSDPTIQVEALMRTLRKHGIPCTRQTIESYRDTHE